MRSAWPQSRSAALAMAMPRYDRFMNTAWIYTWCDPQWTPRRPDAAGLTMLRTGTHDRR